MTIAGCAGGAHDSDPGPCKGCTYRKECLAGMACAPYYNWIARATGKVFLRGPQEPSVEMYQRTFETDEGSSRVGSRRKDSKVPGGGKQPYGSLPYPVTGWEGSVPMVRNTGRGPERGTPA